VRKEIENKYNNRHKEKLKEMNKKNEDYMKNRLKYLEQSLFKK
jgi:hypothetical protein